ncbi:MAG: single-stranded DNA-binding protein [Ruminococcus sp.]|uniref:single-stranded DNA-binding protein n=1 Tax=Ruminococcus sp. TaxID=41978 RepID=UPI0025CD9497|nr:single-stranded DNA-binding protein [Ruminococcus sp.]MBO4866691.1 single-stranded DNA-binding protein [Ruminococcus sp.]
MLNKVILMGRITQDLEVKQTTGGQAVLSFSVAVQRSYKDQSGQYPTDFLDCVAWGQTAEFIGRYFSKGRMIVVEGNLRKRVWEDKNGVKHYPTEIYVDNASFAGDSKPQGGGNYTNNYGGGNNGFGNNNGGYSNGGNGGYNGGGYNNGGFNNNGGFGGNNGGNQNSFNNNNNQAPSNDALNIGDLSEFEDVLSDDGVPF